MQRTSSPQRLQLPIFFALAYLISWALWAPTVLKARGIITWDIPGAGTWGLFGSSVAALVVLGVTEGRAAARQMVSFMTRVRIRWVWLLLSIVGPVSLSLAAVLVGGAVGESASIGKDLPLTVAPLYFLSEILIMLLTEEPGWRGFALPRLQERFGNLTGNLILGLLWACWHLPLFLIPGRPQAAMPFAGFLVAVTAATFLIAWVQNNAGSGLVAVLFHSAMNAGFAALGVLTSGARMFWICTGTWAVAAVAVYLVTGLRGTAATEGVSPANRRAAG